MIGLAFVLAAYEAATGKHNWRNSDTAMARYFEFLETNGYQLSDVERLLIGAPKKRRAATKPVVADGGDTA